MIVPSGFIAAQLGIDRKIREHLLGNKMLAGVVSMPSNIFAPTGTNVSIIFIDDSNKAGVVLLATFNGKEAVKYLSVVVSYDDIAAKNDSLRAGQYFEVKIAYTDLTPAQFATKLQGFSENLDKLFKASAELEQEIKKQLAGLNYE